MLQATQPGLQLSTFFLLLLQSLLCLLNFAVGIIRLGLQVPQTPGSMQSSGMLQLFLPNKG